MLKSGWSAFAVSPSRLSLSLSLRTNSAEAYNNATSTCIITVNKRGVAMSQKYKEYNCK